MPRGPAQSLRWRGCIESLEPRYVLTAGGTVVGDALFTLYDGAVISTLPTDFSRDVATLNGQGEAVGVDERRFGDAVDYSPDTQWTAAPVTLSTNGLQSIIGSGWDHDDQTPLLLHLNQTFNRLTFYRGDDFQVANVLQYNNNDLMRGTVPGERFAPRAAIVHHGLVVIATARSVLIDGVYKYVGVDFIATQDYGVTMERIAVAGGGYGVPVMPESEGMDRLQTWSFLNPFPVDGIDDTHAAWFPWADYLYKTGLPKGGQIGLFRADRPEGSDHWVISPNRVIFSQWIDEDAGGLHAHTAAVTTGGLISHWGDVGYRNVTMFHKFDLENYQTAPVESQIVYGGYIADASAYRLAPQPVAAAPSSVPGEHFAGGDETPDHVLSFGAMSNFADRLDVESVIYQSDIDTPGGVHGGAAMLHLHWLQGVGYVAAATQDNNYVFSPDGEHWIEFSRPLDDQAAATWLYGDRVLAYSGSKFWLTDLPSAEVIHPLQIAPGGKNELPTDSERRRNPAATNTVREVVYTAGLWRYEDTLAPLAIQAPAPPFGVSSPVYEVTVSGDSQDLGGLWLQPLGATSSASQPHVTEMWIANLGEQGVSFGANQGVVNASTGASRFSNTVHHEVNDNVSWIPVGVSAVINGAGEGRAATDWRTYYKTPGAQFLVATPYFGEGLSPTYPLAPQSTGADERETISVPDLGDAWSVGIVARWPQTSSIDNTLPMPIASIVGSGGNAIELSLRYSATTTELRVDVYSAGVRQSTTIVPTRNPEDVQRGDSIEILLAVDGNINITFKVSGDATYTRQTPSVGDLSLDTFLWADRTGDVVTAIDPMLVAFDDRSWGESEREAWLGSTLYEKAIFGSFASPGDFNRDAVVDAADYTVWRDTLYDSTPGRLGDINVDGLIDESDRLAWVAQYGQMGVGLTADLNADGVVDAADYTIWRDQTAPQVVPGSGADADRNGFVELADLQYWINAYGATYPTFESLREAYFADVRMIAEEGADVSGDDGSAAVPPEGVAEFSFFATETRYAVAEAPVSRVASRAATFAFTRGADLHLASPKAPNRPTESIEVHESRRRVTPPKERDSSLDEAFVDWLSDRVANPVLEVR